MTEDRPFVGRLTEKDELKSLILSPGTQLLTLTGMGGMGKTRLAKEVARELLQIFDGVWLLECEAITSREELIGGLASVLGVDAEGAPLDRILRRIEGQRLLMIFDCFERIVGHAALLDRLLASSQDLKVLVTSRKVLHLPRERVWELKPMSMRRAGGKTCPEGLRLFMEAASYSNPSFKLTRKNRSLAMGLVKRLDSVPLAVLLAAGRLRHLSLEEIDQRIAARQIEVLKQGESARNRHRDMLMVVGDSFALLADSDRNLIE